MKVVPALINGAWVPGADPSIVVRNPASGAAVARSAKLGAGDVRAAVAAGRARSWRDRSVWERADVLARAAGDLASRRASVIADLVAESGKPIREARAEVDKAIATFRYYAGLAGALDGRSFEGRAPGVRHETRLEPLGTVGLITPWNVPAAGPARKLAPALLAGNSVVLKPASATPLTAWHLVDALVAAGVDAEALHLVLGNGDDAGWALATDPGLHGLSFTGSSTVGRRIEAAVAGRLMPLQLELGGKNAAVVLADADLDRAADLIISGAFTTAGQQCTATSRVIADERIAEPLTARLVNRIDAILVGDPAHEETVMGPLIDEDRVASTAGFVNRAISEGARLVRGGFRLDRPGCYYAPTLLTGVAATSEVATAEVFGPVLSLLTVGTEDEALAVLNATDYGLSSAVHTNDLAAARRFVTGSDTGIVAVNGSTAGIELAVPFGGFKASGTPSKEHGIEALRFFSRSKSVTWS